MDDNGIDNNEIERRTIGWRPQCWNEDNTICTENFIKDYFDDIVNWYIKRLDTEYQNNHDINIISINGSNGTIIVVCEPSVDSVCIVPSEITDPNSQDTIDYPLIIDNKKYYPGIYHFSNDVLTTFY